MRRRRTKRKERTIKDLPHPRFDWLMAYSEELDRHGLMRQPYDALAEESHEDLVLAFVETLPLVPKDPGETTPTEELDLANAYAEWLTERGELITSLILPPSAVAERLYAKFSRA